MAMAFPARSARHGLLDSGRHSRVMVWIMAIMVFLTVLAAGSGLAIRNGVTALDSALSARLTVQVAEARPGDGGDHRPAEGDADGAQR